LEAQGEEPVMQDIDAGDGELEFDLGALHVGEYTAADR
jgi:hypothetical protein